MWVDCHSNQCLVLVYWVQGQMLENYREHQSYDASIALVTRKVQNLLQNIVFCVQGPD